MNTPNPLLPQGTLPPGNKGRANIYWTVTIIGLLHVAIFAGILLQACTKPKEEAKTTAHDTAPSIPPYTPPEPPPTTTTTTSTPPATSLASTTTASTSVLPPSSSTTLMPSSSSTSLTPSAPDTSMGATKEHVVVKGDSFYSIAKKYNVKQSDVAKANPGVDSSKLKIGQKLQIPASSATPSASGTSSLGVTTPDTGGPTYVVKSGDNLTRIAKNHGTTARAIQDLNNLKSTQIKVGQKLKMPPAKSGPAAAPMTTTSAPAADLPVTAPPPSSNVFPPPSGPAPTPAAPGTPR